MLSAERGRLGAERAWLEGRTADLANADDARNRAFATLAR
jgi:hypothetical protein